MKGTVRVRVNKDGSKSYVCQVKVGRDPGTGKQRVLTGTARTERAAHRMYRASFKSWATWRTRTGTSPLGPPG